MIGLIPCAGRAERLHGLPKYLLPLPDGYLLKKLWDEMKPACLNVYVATNKRNMAFLTGFVSDLVIWNLAVPMTFSVGDTLSMVDTLLKVRPIKKTLNILMAMPDTYWTPQPDLFPQMRDMLSVADVVLAVWRMRDSQRGLLGTVDLDGADVRAIVDKDPASPHPFIWGCVAWRPTFWAYMKPEQPHLGIAVNAAIAGGLRVRAVFAQGDFFDCGTWIGYAELVRALTEEKINADG